eukprot:12274561-Karenia_brevis.AAC.1
MSVRRPGACHARCKSQQVRNLLHRQAPQVVELRSARRTAAPHSVRAGALGRCQGNAKPSRGEASVQRTPRADRLGARIPEREEWPALHWSV